MRVSGREKTLEKRRKNVASHLQLPYSFQKADDSTYYFKTDYGLKYRAYFVRVPSTLCNLYSFSFDKENPDSAYDPRVKNTIVSVLRSFFDADNYVLGYTCDVTDGRELARKRLFDYWFALFNDGSVKKIDFQAENIYVSLIVNRDYFAINETVEDIRTLFVDVLSQK